MIHGIKFHSKEEGVRVDVSFINFNLPTALHYNESYDGIPEANTKGVTLVQSINVL